MATSIKLSDEVEAQIQAIADELDLCFEDTLKRVIGIGVNLYEDHNRGAKVLVKWRSGRIREIIL